MAAEKQKVRAQFKALGQVGIPESVNVEGRRYVFREELKHSFAVGVAVYEYGEHKVVVKLHRQTHFFGIPLKWAGKLMAGYEDAVLKHCSEVPGVPLRRTTNLETAVAHDYIEGHSLSPAEPVDPVFFERLLQLLNRIHKLGVAYVDLEKAENILKGRDGYPYLIDFQVAFLWPEHRPLGRSSLIRFIRKCLQKCDIYHAYKHMKRMRPDLLSSRERFLAERKPWPVRLANAFLLPWQLLRKAIKK